MLGLIVRRVLMVAGAVLALVWCLDRGVSGIPGAVVEGLVWITRALLAGVIARVVYTSLRWRSPRTAPESL